LLGSPKAIAEADTSCTRNAHRGVIKAGHYLDSMCAASIKFDRWHHILQKACNGATMRRSLEGCRLLIVGSDWITDRAVHKLLDEQGCDIFGPFTSEATAREVLHQRTLDAAIIDLPTDSTAVHRLADDLVSAHVPFLFLTNPGSIAVPSRFQSHPRLLKPFNEGMLLERVCWQVTWRIGSAVCLSQILERARHISPCNTVAIEAVKSGGSSTF